MIRSSTKELTTPFENPKSVFRLKRRLFKKPGLVESSLPELDLFSDVEEHPEEETIEIMMETMDQYMSKTRGDYGSGVVRPRINDKTHFELKGQYLKELRKNTFSSSEHEDANEHIEKVLEIIYLFHIPEVTQDQVMLCVFPMSLTGAASRWLKNELSCSITNWETLKTKFLNKYYPPARTAKKMEEINNFQQEPDESLFRAWERFKELLMKCPLHYLTDIQEVILFYNGLDVPTRQILNSKIRHIKMRYGVFVAIQHMAPLLHRDLRHPWLRYQVEGYTEDIVRNFEHRLETIFSREATFTSHPWRRIFEVRGPLLEIHAGSSLAPRQFISVLGLHTSEEMVEDGFGAYWYGSERFIPDKGDLRDYWIEISSDRDLIGVEKVTGVDLFYLRTMDHGTANVPYLLAQYLLRHAEGRKSGARLSRGHFIGYLTAHFGPPVPGDQEAAGAPGSAEDAPRIERLEEEMCELWQSVMGLRGVVKSSITKKTRVSTWMISCMTQLMDVSSRTYQAFDNIIVGSSLVPYQRRVRPRTGDANTSIAPHIDDQPNP
ncbi:retrovirus-related pol polyprotein from transposon TNT 1-94 [Tanacetum coccineum]